MPRERRLKRRIREDKKLLPRRLGACTPRTAGARPAKGVRPSIPGSPIPQPEKNRRVCAKRWQARILQVRLERVRLPSHPLGYVSRCGRRMHRLLYLGTAARGAVCIVCQGAQWSAPAPSSSRESPGINSPVRGEGGAYATSASWLRLFHCFSTRSRGAQTSGLASFIVVAAPPGRSEQNRSSPPPHSQWRE